MVSARVSMPAIAGMLCASSQRSSAGERAIVRRMLGIGAHDQPAHRRRQRLDVFVIGADNADMGKGEGDDLSGIGGIGEDLLIARHRGVEADFADRLRRRAEALPSKTVPSASTSFAVARKSASAGWAEAGDSISLIGKASDLAENRDDGAGGQAYWERGYPARPP